MSRAGYIIAAVAALATVSTWMLQGEPEAPGMHLTPQVAEMLRAQQELPVESVAALQDLRLAASVQMAYSMEKGGYAEPLKLKEEGYLDPQWPRAEAQAYSVFCELGAGRRSFDCFADARKAGLPSFAVDASQAVRWSLEGRPGSRSNVFGVKEEQP